MLRWTINRRLFHSINGRAKPVNTIIKFVPQQEAWIVERMGKFHRVLQPGLNFLLPLLDEIKHVQSLKEQTIEIPSQSAITQDNVTLSIDGVLYLKVTDPIKASYGIENHVYAMTQLAQTTMRAEIGVMSLDKTLSQRAHLNANIVESINQASAEWGVKCLRYEIKDIHPPPTVVQAMHSQVSAERQKRADILASEGQRQAAINIAEGARQAVILKAEGDKQMMIESASGEAEAMLLKSEASAEAIRRVAKAIREGGEDASAAISLKVAQEYVESFGKIAKQGTTILLPSNISDPAGMITQAMTVFGAVQKSQHSTGKKADPIASTDGSKLKFPV